MRRPTIVGCFANLAALFLLGLTCVALANPFPPGSIPGFFEASFLGGASAEGWIDTLSPFVVSGSSVAITYFPVLNLYPLIDMAGSSSTLLFGADSIVGYILGSTISALSSVGSSLGVLQLFDLTNISSGLEITTAPFRFEPVPGLSVPAPNGIAVLVTGIAALATLMRRRALRRYKG